MIDNNINATVPDFVLQRIITALRDITAYLPFLISLTSEERQSVNPIGDNRWPYVLKGVDFAQKHRVKIGMSVEDLAEIEQVSKLFADLGEIFTLVEDLRLGLRDTRMQIGSNLYRLTRNVHTLMKLAHAKGKPGMEFMLDSMDKLFENQGKPSPNNGDDPGNTDDGNTDSGNPSGDGNDPEPKA